MADPRADLVPEVEVRVTGGPAGSHLPIRPVPLANLTRELTSARNSSMSRFPSFMVGNFLRRFSRALFARRRFDNMLRHEPIVAGKVNLAFSSLKWERMHNTGGFFEVSIAINQPACGAI